MDRIAIVGCGGSGKSHLARQLGALLAVAPVHLDGLYYAGDWKRLDQDQFIALQRDLAAAPQWIIDGNYASTLPIRLQAADTVVFLDLPAWACLWGVVQRRLRHGGGQHHTIGVYDQIAWNFIRYIAGYRRQMAPRVRQLIASHAAHAQVVVLAIAVPSAASSPTWPHRRPLLPAWPLERSAADFLAWHQAPAGAGLPLSSVASSRASTRTCHSLGPH